MTPAGLERLKLDEGCDLHAYPDPLSGAEPFTIGYGCTGDEIVSGLVWMQAQADAELSLRVMQTQTALESRLAPWFVSLTPVRQDVLTNIAFNIGIEGLLQWPQTLAAVSARITMLPPRISQAIPCGIAGGCTGRAMRGCYAIRKLDRCNSRRYLKILTLLRGKCRGDKMATNFLSILDTINHDAITAGEYVLTDAVKYLPLAATWPALSFRQPSHRSMQQMLSPIYCRRQSRPPRYSLPPQA